MLIGAPWPTDGSYIFTPEDYIHSVLIDNPNGYILNNGRTIVYIFIVGKGMIRIVNDFRAYTDPEVAMYVFYVKQSL